MIPVADARARILAALRPTAAEIVPLAEAWGRVTAAPVLSRLTQPPRDVSAMDGYAVRAQDAMLGAALRVVGNAPAGHPWEGTVQPGETVLGFGWALADTRVLGIAVALDGQTLCQAVTSLSRTDIAEQFADQAVIFGDQNGGLAHAFGPSKRTLVSLVVSALGRWAVR